MRAGFSAVTARKSTLLGAAAVLAAWMCAPSPVPAQIQSQTQAQPDRADKTERAGKLPRFASLRSGEVNVRSGPGPRFPVDWVFKRRDMPVEIVAEFDTWRKVRDFENTEGWVHQALLSPQRYVLVVGDEMRALLKNPEEHAPAMAKVEPGVVGQLLQCEPGWCRIRVAKVTGWIQRSLIWGVYEDEDGR